MSEEVKQIFSDISPTYDTLNHLLSLQIDKSWRKKTISRIEAKPGENVKALDLCAGTLDLSLEFLKQFPDSMVWATDFSLAMLQKGAHKIAASQTGHISLVGADALNLPFADKSFDVAFCGYGFRNLDSPEKGLREIYRVLKPDGQILILDFFKPENFFSRFFHSTYGQFLMPLIGGLVSKNREAYRYLYRSINNFYTLNECVKLFRQVGFQVSESFHFMRGISSLIVARKKEKYS